MEILQHYIQHNTSSTVTLGAFNSHRHQHTIIIFFESTYYSIHVAYLSCFNSFLFDTIASIKGHNNIIIIYKSSSFQSTINICKHCVGERKAR